MIIRRQLFPLQYLNMIKFTESIQKMLRKLNLLEAYHRAKEKKESQVYFRNEPGLYNKS